MDKLDKYINSICKNLKGNNEEIDIMKKEVKNHLLQSVEELKAQGKSREESIDIAIDRFGEIDILKKQLKEVYNVQKSFSRRIFNIALVILIIGIVSLISQIFIHYNSQSVDTKLLYSIQNTLKSDDGAVNDKLKSLFEANGNKFKFYNKELKYIAVFKYPENYTGNIDTSPIKEAKYIYPSVDKLNKDLKRTGYISNASSDREYVANNSKWRISVHYVTPRLQWMQYGLNNIVNIIGIICIVSSSILFIISILINIYHKNRIDFAVE